MHASTGGQGRRGRAGRDPAGGWRWVPLGDSLSRVSHMYYGMSVLHVCCPVEFCVFAGCYWFCCLCVVGYWLCISLVFVNCFFCVMKNPCVCFAGVQRFVFAVYIGFMSDLGGVRYSFCGWCSMDFFNRGCMVWLYMGGMGDMGCMG